MCVVDVALVHAHPEHPPYDYEDTGHDLDYSSGETLLPATDLSLSLLSFAVGVAACLLVVRAMLPTLVRAHCAEVVREYIDRSSRESDVKVVVIDRDAEARNQTAHVVPVQSRQSGRVIRVDAASATAQAPTGTSAPHDPQTQSILGRVYEQNLQLKKQLRSEMNPPNHRSPGDRQE